MTNRDMKNYRSLDPHWTKKPGITILIIILIILILAALDNRDRAHIQEMIEERDQRIHQLQQQLQPIGTLTFTKHTHYFGDSQL